MIQIKRPKRLASKALRPNNSTDDVSLKGLNFSDIEKLITPKISKIAVMEKQKEGVVASKTADINAKTSTYLFIYPSSGRFGVT